MHSLCVFLGHVLTINRVELNTVPDGGDQRPIDVPNLPQTKIITIKIKKARDPQY